MRENRDYLVEAFKQIVDDANDLLHELREEGANDVLNNLYGGLLTDSEIITNKGTFRKNPSRLNMKQLDHMIKLLNDFLDAKEKVDKYTEDTKEIARRLGVRTENAHKVLSLLEYAKQKVSEGALDSYQLRDIINARVEAGQTVNQIKQAIDDAILYAQQDPDIFFQNFSENGRLI